MLGRAVQLTFPFQTPDEEHITDSQSAASYLRMALHVPRQASGIPLSQLQHMRLANEDGSYLWGDYVTKLVLNPAPDVRLLNLETAVTHRIRNADVPLKGINYHMNASNLPLVFACFAAKTFATAVECNGAGVPYVVCLGNNHILDFGRLAFESETLPALATLPGPAYVTGGGCSLEEASRAAQVSVGGDCKVCVVAFGTECSGVLPGWAATPRRSGIVVLPALTSHAGVQKALAITTEVLQRNSVAHPCPKGNMVLVVSIHWGPNWAYRSQHHLDGQRYRQMFAHQLVSDLGVDLIYLPDLRPLVAPHPRTRSLPAQAHCVRRGRPHQ